ncbi:MAG: ribosome biogenesis GTPase Der [Gammaproteobacteria bacterium]|nr:ribosome biogenesis GTPase Der [Gammaproteobacteria bacterium]
MLPVIALVGRPNVGKSTLFNRLTLSRDALVANLPGLTRDRQYGIGKMGAFPYVLVDTGGISGEAEGIDPLMERQVRLAIAEADHILLLVDARDGCTPGDLGIIDSLRRLSKPVTLVVNKSDGMDTDVARLEFHAAGLGEPVPIAASQGRGVRSLIDRVLASLPEPDLSNESPTEEGVKIAVVGRPNVGKSTLVNRLLGEERVVAFDQPGTTRDSIFIPFQRDGRAYTLIDTAGVRRRSRVSEAVEKFSIIKTLQAIDTANVVILVLDARDGVTEQDATLAGHIIDSGRALVVAVNKWDGMDSHERDQVKAGLQRRLPFLDFAAWRFISALHGSGVGNLPGLVDEAYRNAVRDLATSELTRLLEQAVFDHQPPLVHGRRIKLRYAHQGGRNPPVIVIHGNQTEALPDAYKRYLINYFRQALQIRGTPIRLELKTGENPFAGRKNTLTPRQVHKKKRLARFVKRK